MESWPPNSVRAKRHASCGFRSNSYAVENIPGISNQFTTSISMSEAKRFWAEIALLAIFVPSICFFTTINVYAWCKKVFEILGNSLIVFNLVLCISAMKTEAVSSSEIS
jgi:hypothetical protein